MSRFSAVKHLVRFFVDIVEPWQVREAKTAFRQRYLDVPATTHHVLDRLHWPRDEAAALARLTARAAAVGMSGVELALALEVVAESPAEPQHCARAELVATYPNELQLTIPRTMDAALALVRSAKIDVVIFGYLFVASADELIAELLEARRRGVEVLIIAQKVELLRKALREHWESADLRPALYQLSEDADTSLMHAKTIIVDSHKMLVTSANLTFSGMNRNIEIGVLVAGRECGKARELVTALIASGYVVPVV